MIILFLYFMTVYVGEVEIEDTGIYLVMSSMPDQTKVRLQFYLNLIPFFDPALHDQWEGVI